MPDVDPTLLRAAQRGDLAAFGQLVAPHAQVLYRLALHLTGWPSDAEDAVQEGLIRAHRSIGKVREDAPIRPWLLQVIANEARSLVRSRGRRSRLLDRLQRHPHGEAPDPAFVVIAGETRDEVTAALARLRPDDREVIVYRYFLELGEAEMAALLGCPRGTVKSRLSRALGRLRIELGTSLVDPEATWRA